jgi:hypothetical protein
MFKSSLSSIIFLALSFAFFTGCSPKVKLGLWVRNHQEAASALEAWGANHPDEAATLFNLDCTDRNQFKKKITDALNTAPQETIQQNNTATQQYYPYGNASHQNQGDGFTSWCRKYPSAAKKLRSHAKAVCKAGTGMLNGSIKMK